MITVCVRLPLLDKFCCLRADVGAGLVALHEPSFPGMMGFLLKSVSITRQPQEVFWMVKRGALAI